MMDFNQTYESSTQQLVKDHFCDTFQTNLAGFQIKANLLWLN